MNHLLTVYEIGWSNRPPKLPARRTKYLPGTAYCDGTLPHVGQGCCTEQHNVDVRFLCRLLMILLIKPVKINKLSMLKIILEIINNRLTS